MPNDIVELAGTALAAAIRGREVSCVEVMRACLDQIGRLNPKVNAIVALRDPETLLAEARERDAEIARGHYRGWLHGFPQAIKDLLPVEGIACTQGSPIFRDFIPTADAVMVERMRAAGAIIIGKTNTPEFGHGSQTHNRVYGTTLNAYDPARTAGGSSGGAAVALALRMLPVADGSDFMGSLRNPGAWNNVFGFRTSPGRVPYETRDVFLPGMGVLGPMARTVPDLAMLLSVTAGHDPRVPLSLREDPRQFAEPLKRGFKGVRIAWSGDFGGKLAFEPGVLELCERSLADFRSLGCSVEKAVPDFPMEAAWESFVTLRWWINSSNLGVLYDDPGKRAEIKPETLWEIEHGRRLSAAEVTAASATRTAWYHAMRSFLSTYDYFLVPSAQVFPFDAGTHWPAEIAGRRMDSYHRWMEATVPATLAGLPALNVPVGFGGDGLPMGMQIIGPPGADLACLQLAHAYDEATGWVMKRKPKLL